MYSCRDLEFTASPAGIFLHFLQWPQELGVIPHDQRGEEPPAQKHEVTGSRLAAMHEAEPAWNPDSVTPGPACFIPTQVISPVDRYSSFCLFISNSRIWSLGLSNL